MGYYTHPCKRCGALLSYNPEKQGSGYCGRCIRWSHLSQVRTLTSVEAAWFAGVLESEGSVIKDRTWWKLYIGNTDIELISTLLRVAGCGQVSYVPMGSNPLQKKLAWMWKLSQSSSIDDLLRQLQPYMISKGAAYYAQAA